MVMTAADPMEMLDGRECWELLELAPIGRIALSAAGEIDIFPINFVVHDHALYFRTAPGTKLVELAINPQVAVEIDGWDEGEAFSVVAKGEAERLERAADIDAAEQLPLTPWVPTSKYTWVRIRPEMVSGRRFRRAPEAHRR